MQSIYTLAALASLAHAFTPPTEATFGALLTPDLSTPVTQGETFKVTWDATGHEKSTVSLVLCRGDSTNCQTDTTAIVEKVPAGAESYEWDVPCSLPAGKQATSTGYGMLIIEDGTGIFQYSTQFSVLENKQCGSSGSSTGGSGKPSSTTPSGIHLPPPTEVPGYNGTKWPESGSISSTIVPTKPTDDKPWSTLTPSSTAVAAATTPATVTYSTASVTSSPTAAVQSITPGNAAAGRNAAGALFLGALGAAFML